MRKPQASDMNTCFWPDYLDIIMTPKNNGKISDPKVCCKHSLTSRAILGENAIKNQGSGFS